MSTPNSAVTLRQLGQPQTTFLHNTASLMPIQARAPAAAAAALDALQCGRVGVCTSASTATATAAALAAQPQLRDEQHSVPGHGAAQQPPPAASPPRKRQRTVPKQPTLTGKAPPAASAAKQRRRGGGGATAPGAIHVDNPSFQSGILRCPSCSPCHALERRAVSAAAEHRPMGCRSLDSQRKARRNGMTWVKAPRCGMAALCGPPPKLQTCCTACRSAPCFLVCSGVSAGEL